MKKIFALLLICLVSITTLAAETTEATTDPSFTGTVQTKKDKTLDVTINSTVDEVAYDLNISYDNVLQDPSKTLTISGTDYVLTQETAIETKVFSVYTGIGNLNKTVNVKVDISPESFKSTLDGEEHDSTITPYVVNKAENLSTLENDKTFSNTITAGYNTKVDIAKFALAWIGDAEVAAGTYSSNIKINYYFD